METPALRGRATDRLLTSIYQRFQEEGIEIPYPRRDLVVREPLRLHTCDDEDDGA